MVKKRREIAEFYHANLKSNSSIVLPPIVEGAIYSHYCARVKDRDGFINKMREKGISIGCYFDYCIPELKAYWKYKKVEFPNSLICSREVVNLPNYLGLCQRELEYIINSLSTVLSV